MRTTITELMVRAASRLRMVYPGEYYASGVWRWGGDTLYIKWNGEWRFYHEASLRTEALEEAIVTLKSFMEELEAARRERRGAALRAAQELDAFLPTYGMSE